jgi:hypothetical protein
MRFSQVQQDEDPKNRGFPALFVAACGEREKPCFSGLSDVAGRSHIAVKNKPAGPEGPAG